jgi:HPt (histidine-containing phosphotransfer) domain-containing protein
LFRVLERVLGVGVPEGDVVLTEPEVYDRSATLELMAGEESLLAEVAGLFLKLAPSLIARLRQAVAVGDARALRGTAHELKGSLCCFQATPATAMAERLEQMGARDILTGATEALRDLEQEVERLSDALYAEGFGNAVDNLPLLG